jgi:two-component system CheB/CheR fusion protein
VITIRDVTEKSLRHLQDEWLAVAGHELRTPVAALQGYLQLALRETSTQNDASIRNRVERSLAQVSRISQLVDQMVDASRFQYGHIYFNFQEIDLVPLIEEAVETASQVRAGTIITFTHREDSMKTRGDARRLEQAMLNVLTNAILHSQDGVQIGLSLSRENGHLQILITDNGPGIPEETLDTLFQRFSRGSTLSSGLGLGLYIAREIMVAHGGSIDVDSTVGAGTTVTITLPATDGAPSG